MVKNSQKLIILMFSFIILFIFIISPSYAIIVKTLNIDKIYSKTIPSVLDKGNYILDISRKLTTNWTNFNYGIEPTKSNFYTKITTGCKLFIDNAFTFTNTKSLRYYDLSTTYYVNTTFSISNNSNYYGFVDTIISFNNTIAPYQYFFFKIFNNNSFVPITNIMIVYLSATHTMSITTVYYSGTSPENAQQNVISDVAYLSVRYDLVLNRQEILVLDQNKNLQVNITKTLSQIYYAGIIALKTYVYFGTTTTYRCDATVLGFSHSFKIGYNRYDAFNYTSIESYGYYSQIIFNLFLSSLFPNVIGQNLRIQSGNVTFTIMNNTKEFTWFQIGLQKDKIISAYLYPLYMANLTFLSILLSYFDTSNKLEEIIQIRIKLTLVYDYNDKSLFNLYLSASIPIAFIALLPLFGYKIGKKRKEVYWFSLFATILSVVIWRGIFLTLGGIVAITSILIILIEKYRGEHNDY